MKLKFLAGIEKYPRRKEFDAYLRKKLFYLTFAKSNSSSRKDRKSGQIIKRYSVEFTETFGIESDCKEYIETGLKDLPNILGLKVFAQSSPTEDNPVRSWGIIEILYQD